jgi:hypothetical protein
MAIYGVTGAYDAKTPPPFRMALSRVWDPSKPAMMVIGVNPSTASHEIDDPTIQRCLHDGQRLGFGALWMGNLLPYRATDPDDMRAYYKSDTDQQIKAASDAVNLLQLEAMARSSGLVVCAWGDDGAFMGQSRKVVEYLRRRVPNKPLHCWKVSEGKKEPRHRLYLPHGMTPMLLP